MLILSQDKTCIVNIDTTNHIKIQEWGEDYEIKSYFNDNVAFLGLYPTEERAKEVLRNINSAYINNEMLKMSKITIREDISMFKLAENICFAMPEK